MKITRFLHKRAILSAEILYQIVNAVCNTLLMIQIVAVTIVVGGRFVFSRSPAWGEELSLLAMVWFTMLSVGIGFRNENHIRMTVLDRVLPQKALMVLAIINDLTIFAFAAVLIKHGTDVVILNLNWMSSALRLSMGILYAAVPVGAGFMILMLALKLLCRVIERRGMMEAHDA